MKKNDKSNINAVAMIRKIRDDNYELLKNKSRQERLNWLHKRAEEAKTILTHC